MHLKGLSTALALGFTIAVVISVVIGTTVYFYSFRKNEAKTVVQVEEQHTTGKKVELLTDQERPKFQFLIIKKILFALGAFFLSMGLVLYLLFYLNW